VKSAAALLAVLLMTFAPSAFAQPLDPAEAADHSPGLPAHVEARVEVPIVPSARPKILTGEIKTERFRIVHTAAAAGAARALAADIERIRSLFVGTLGRDWPGVTEIRVGVGREEYEAIALPGGVPPKWSVALAYPAHNIMLLDAISLNAPGGNQTLRHELSHVALGRLGPSWPRWFQEGLAMHLTGERYAVNQYTALFRAVTQDRVFHFADLREGWPEQPADVEIAYAQSLSFVETLLGHHGSARFGELLDAVGAGEDFELAFSRVMKTSLVTEENAWRDALPRRYSWWPIVATSTSVLAFGAVLLFIAWIRRRYQYAKRMTELLAQEQAEDAALRAAEAAADAALLEDESAPSTAPAEAVEKPTLH
jgi:hypothetical protein